MESLVARLEAVAARLEAQAGAPAPAKGTATPSAASPGTVHPSVAAFDEILTGPLKALTTAAGTLNEPEIADATTPVSYTHLTLPTILACRSRWSPYH